MHSRPFTKFTQFTQFPISLSIARRWGRKKIEELRELGDVRERPKPPEIPGQPWGVNDTTGKRRRQVTRKQRKLDVYRAGNIVAAAIILSHFAVYGGEGSFMVRWARMVLASAQEETAGGRS
jgi:hypothetical protein